MVVDEFLIMTRDPPYPSAWSMVALLLTPVTHHLRLHTALQQMLECHTSNKSYWCSSIDLSTDVLPFYIQLVTQLNKYTRLLRMGA